MSRLEGVDEVNQLPWWESRPPQPTPQASDRKEDRQVLLVDKSGRPLIVREPRPVGFRRP